MWQLCTSKKILGSKKIVFCPLHGYEYYNKLSETQGRKDVFT